MTTAGVLAVLLGLCGILGTLVVGGLVVALGFLLDALSDGKGGTSQDQVSGAAIGVAVVLVAVGVLLGSLHVVLGVRVMRGGAVARVVLTLWDGLTALLALVGLVLVVVVSLSSGAGQTEGTGMSLSLSLAWLPVLVLVPTVVVLVGLWTPTATAWFAHAQHPDRGTIGG